MKLSIAILLFSAALAPFVFVSGTVYTCSSVGTFNGKDDPKHPQVPSKTSLDWMTNEMLQTFVISYLSNTDLNMTSERFAKFTMKRERDSEGDSFDSTTNNTSVSFLDKVTGYLRGRTSTYRYRYVASSQITCRL